MRKLTTRADNIPPILLPISFPTTILYYGAVPDTAQRD